MNKRHALGVTILVGAAAVAGMLAVTRTVQLGEAADTSPAALEARATELDQVEAQIRLLDASVPPAVPPRSSTATVDAATGVVYVRATSEDSSEEDRDDHEDDEAHDHGDDRDDHDSALEDDEWEERRDDD